MPRLREPTRLADAFYLIMRRVGARELARITITELEHGLSQTACEDKIRSEGRLPPGRWERNTGGKVRLGGTWNFAGTTNGDLEPGDGYHDVAGGRLVIKPSAGARLIELKTAAWAVTRGAGGLTVRTRADSVAPLSIALEDGELTIKDLALVEEDMRR